MADDEDGNKQVCNYCKNVAVKKRVKCENCGAFFHKSCALRGSCCTSKLFNEEKDNLNTEENQLLEVEVKSILIENNQLMEMNTALKQQNMSLTMKIVNLEAELTQIKRQGTAQQDVNFLTVVEAQTLKQNIIGEIKTLTDKLHADIKIIKRKVKLGSKNNQNIKNNISSYNGNDNDETLTKTQQIQTKQIEKKVSPDTGCDRNRNDKTLTEIVSRQCAKLTNEQENVQITVHSLEQQQKLMQNIINLDRDDDTDNGYKTVTYKKRRDKTIDKDNSHMFDRNRLLEGNKPQQEVNISSPPVSASNKSIPVAEQMKKRAKTFRGLGEDKNGKFKGESRKVWLFLYKVKQDVTEQDIITYLKEKTQEEAEFVVKTLKTKDGNKFKEFMVAADFKFKNDFYNPKFWPRDILFRRFDFKKYYDRYHIRDVIKGEVEEEERPQSFLEQRTQTSEKKQI